MPNKKPPRRRERCIRCELAGRVCPKHHVEQLERMVISLKNKLRKLRRELVAPEPDELTVGEAAKELGVEEREIRFDLFVGLLPGNKRRGLWFVPKWAIESHRRTRRLVESGPPPRKKKQQKNRSPSLGALLEQKMAKAEAA